MALPAGRYGVTKNQLLKIKKLPMNTIKLIEELTEKFNLLGTAAFKNSTSVVTESSDLVESGGVYTALQGKADNSVIGTVEDGTNPTKAYAVGEHMIRGGKFCTVTVAVTTSSTWTLGSNYVEGDVAQLFTKQKITGIAADGTILKGIVSNDSYIIPAYKLVVLNLLVQVGKYEAWGMGLTGLPKPANNVCAVIANRGKSTAMLLSILEQGNAQLANITGADPVENNVIVIATTYNYDSL